MTQSTGGTNSGRRNKRRDRQLGRWKNDEKKGREGRVRML
jgi:hypothetical protein